jgi:NAD-dependent DNA ligase
MASEGTATRLCRAGFGSLEEIADAGEDTLVAVEDIGPKVAASLSEHPTRLAPNSSDSANSASRWTSARKTSHPSSPRARRWPARPS